LREKEDSEDGQREGFVVKVGRIKKNLHWWNTQQDMKKVV
jgi:hypothetical protein